MEVVHKNPIEIKFLVLLNYIARLNLIESIFIPLFEEFLFH